MSTEHRATLARDGFLRFPRAIEPTADLGDAVWAHLAGRGIDRTDPDSWPTGTVTHLDRIRADGALERGGSAVLDAVLGAGRWKLPKRGGQLVVTFPQPGPWTLPTRVWHTDSPYTEPLEPVFGALVFEFLERVDARSGGTLVIAGSHRVAARFATSRPTVGTEKMATTRRAFLRTHPWLNALATDDSEPATRMERFSAETEIDGLPVRVVELTGEPGDVVVTHPLMVHCIAPNCGDRPRIMRIRRPRVTVISERL